jgi:hypothetical protein
MRLSSFKNAMTNIKRISKTDEKVPQLFDRTIFVDELH